MKRLLIASFALLGLVLPAQAQTRLALADEPGCCHTIEADIVEVVVAPNADAIRRIQAELAVRGFNPGPIDGVIGPRTDTAIRAFQRDQGLLEGLVTVETLARLGIAVQAHGQEGARLQPQGACMQAPAPQRLSGCGCAQPSERRVIRRIVERRVIEPATTAPARTSLPNYVGQGGNTHQVAPLDWAGKTPR